MELAIILALGTMIFWGVGDFFIQKSARKIGNIEMLVFIGIIGSIIFLPFLIIQGNLITNWRIIIFLVALGALAIVHALLIIKAFNIGKLSVIEVVAQIELPVTIALSIIFLHEKLTSWQFLMILFVFSGVILASMESWRDWKGNIEKGVVIAAISGLLMGADNFLTGFASKSITPIMALALPWVAFMVVALIIAWKNGEIKNVASHTKEYWPIILVATLGNVLGWICFVFAVEKNPISIVAAIAEGYVVVALLLGITVNREKIRWYQYIGAILALAGSIFLAMMI